MRAFKSISISDETMRKIDQLFDVDQLNFSELVETALDQYLENVAKIKRRE
jgi:predicted transcriptional regulator